MDAAQLRDIRDNWHSPVIIQKSLLKSLGNDDECTNHPV